MAQSHTQQLSSGLEPRIAADNKSTAEHTPEHKQSKGQAAYEATIEMDLDEDDGQTLGRTVKNRTEKHTFQIDSAPRIVQENKVPEAYKQPQETVQMAAVDVQIKENTEKQRTGGDQIVDMLEERIKQAQKETNVLYIPNFSDVGRINQMEQEEILQEVEEELQEQLRDKQIQLHDLNTGLNDSKNDSKLNIKAEMQPTKAVQPPISHPDFTPRASTLQNRLLQKASPQKEIQPEKEKPCCSLF